jgi:hypothetical protein
MKTFSIIHILLFILLMLVYQCAGAQDFLVTTKGDTIFGETRPVTFSTEKKVTIVDNEKKKSTYSMFQIRTYSNRNEIFVPVRTATGFAFMKVIKSGYLSLLKFQLDNQVTYDGQYLLKMDGTGIEVPNLTFKKTVTKFLGDCADVTKQIDDGDLGKNDIEHIVDEYNGCVSKRTQGQKLISSEKKLAEEKISSWDALESKIKSKADFKGKMDALDMIAEIKLKISRKEKVPNFIIEGLKSSLSEAELATELDAALKELQN